MTRVHLAATLAVSLGALAAAPEASAGGLYVSDRGVRPLGRGGAFVAGADDLGAIWYNPAGVVATPSSLLLDGSWIDYSDSFTRQALSTSAPPTQTTFVQTMPRVTGTTPFLPIPTIAGSYRWGETQKYAAAFGVYAPDAALLDYPEQVGGQAAPQRYSLLSLRGSLLAVLGGWFAYQPFEQLQIGAGVQMLTGFLKTTVDISTCAPDNFMCAQEDPNYDAFSRVSAGPIFAPSANAGVTWIPKHVVRVAVSAQGPFVVNAPATVDVTLPNAVFFDKAYQQGNSAHLHIELPPILRAGVEVRPLSSDDLRIEVAYVREFWSVQKSLDITPRNIELYGITGFPSPYGVASISIPRGMQDTNSVRLGGEYAFEMAGVGFRGRVGVAYETSSLPVAYVTPFTVDNSKVTASVGGSIVLGLHLRLDGVISHAFQGDVNVPPREAAVPLINPVKGNPTAPDYVNGGMYSANLWVIGGGLEYRF
jgi:long-chain fatty acid transport protein